MAISTFPLQYSTYVALAMVKKNNVLNSGKVLIDKNPPLRKSGEKFSIPFIYSLDNTLSDMQQVTSTTTITPTAFTSSEIYVPAVTRGDGLKVTEYELIKSGVDPFAKIGDQIATYVSNSIQTTISKVLEAAFDSTNGVLYSTNYYLGTADASTIDYTQVNKAKLKLGENGQTLDTIVVNSSVYAAMTESGLTQVPATQYGETMFKTGLVDVYNGLRVIVNDSICTANGDSTYKCYLLGGQPIYLGYQRDLTLYDDFDPATGRGTHKKFFYVDYGLGINGVSYTGSTMNPSNTDLATATNYTLKDQYKNIKVVRLDAGGLS